MNVNLKCFDRISIKDLKVKPHSISSTYSLEMDGIRREYKLIESYTENINIREVKGIEELASLISIVPVVNYALFTDEISIDFPIIELDLKFMRDMSEITSRDVFVNRIARGTGLVKGEYIPDPESISLMDAKPRASIYARRSTSTALDEIDGEYTCGTMLSGGKDSLLTYSLLKEAGCKVYPFFLNESGRHWLSALKAYRYFSKNIPLTRRVWSNIDRLFAFIERNMKIVVPNFMRKSRELYPIRLFWFEHYAFSFLPLIMKYKVGNINFGNEFDDPTSSSFTFRGIEHYNAIYDQSQSFEKYMTNWFGERGLGIKQWSPIRPISGLIVEKILYERYRAMIQLQMSCHSPKIVRGELIPCGSCFKCTGVMIFLLANGIDPKMVGYTTSLSEVLARVREGKYRLDKDELEHSLFLMGKRFLIKSPKASYHPHVETIHFDNISSHLDFIPQKKLRERVLGILERYTKGYSVLRGNKWEIMNKEKLSM